jgi:hypothetical protein
MSALIEPLPERNSIKEHVFLRMGALFVRYPHLVGFFLQDPIGFKDVLNPSPIEGDLCILDIGFSIEMSDASYEKVRELIRATVQELITERPEAFAVLRERTFARALH